MDDVEMLNHIKNNWGAEMNPKHIVWLLRQAERYEELKKNYQSLSSSLEEIKEENRILRKRKGIK